MGWTDGQDRQSGPTVGMGGRDGDSGARRSANATRSVLFADDERATDRTSAGLVGDDESAKAELLRRDAAARGSDAPSHLMAAGDSCRV